VVRGEREKAWGVQRDLGQEQLSKAGAVGQLGKKEGKGCKTAARLKETSCEKDDPKNPSIRLRRKKKGGPP